MSEGAIIDELTRCENLLRNTYGVTGAPFIRPPYGSRSSFTDSVCAKAGYTTAALWYGSFGDSGLLTQDVLLGEAQKWLLAQHIVIGHANFPTITQLYGQIIDILRQRSLLTATLDDVYFGPRTQSSRLRRLTAPEPPWTSQHSCIREASISGVRGR